MYIRSVEEKDFPAIDQKLKEAIWLKESKRWTLFVDPVKVEQVLKGNSHLPVIILEETFLIVFNITTPWYISDTKQLLQELLVLKIYDTAKPVSLIPKALQYMCQKLNLCGVMAGAVLPDDPFRLLKVYYKAGFTLQGGSVYWEPRKCGEEI